MVRFRVNRKFLYKKDADLSNYLKIVGTNVSTKPEFATIRDKGVVLKTKNEEFHTAYIAVLEGDYRQKATRDELRGEVKILAREIADDVNELADGSEVIITAAGFEAVATPSKDRQMGETELLSVEYLSDTNMVKLRCIQADRAADYQIDVLKEGETVWELGVDSMPLTLFYIEWKKGKGKFQIRLCPRGKDGKRGTPSNILPITIY